MVLGHGFWQRAFGGDRSIVGRTIVLNSHRVPVRGVTPPEFTGLEVGRAYDVAVPICAQQALGGGEEWLGDSMVWWLTVMGRLPAGRSLETVTAELEAWSVSLFEESLPAQYPPDRVGSYLNLRLRAVPGSAGVSSLRDRYGDPLLALLAVTGLVLLMVCTNLANLFLARGKGRQHEFAVRRALGASGGHLLRDLSIESIVLAVGGAAGGLALAGVLSGRLLDFLGTDLWLDLSLSGAMVSFVVVAAGLSALLFGLIPAWVASASGGDSGLDAVRDGRGTAGASRGAGLRRVLVVSQVALSFVLLFGALLFASTLRNLLAVDTGFDSSGVAIARVDFRTLELAESSRPAFKLDLLERIRGVPGITSAAEVRHVPMGGTGSSATIRRGEELPAGVSVRVNGVTPGYLEAMGMPLLAGRAFDPSYAPDAPVAIVTQAFASRLGLAPNPVGETFRVEGSPETMEIIGVVPDAKYFNLREDPVPTAFVPKDLLSDVRSYTDFVIRTTLPPVALPDILRQAVAAVSTGIWIDVRPLDDIIGEGLVRERLMSTVSGFFGILAALVAAIGLYGVMSHHVAQRRNEVAVRVALGARRRAIILMVLFQAGALLCVGLALGVVLASVASTAARQFLFGLGSHHVPTYALAAGLLTLTAGIACYLPARRAARTEPQKALRSE